MSRACFLCLSVLFVFLGGCTRAPVGSLTGAMSGFGPNQLDGFNHMNVMGQFANGRCLVILALDRTDLPNYEGHEVSSSYGNGSAVCEVTWFNADRSIQAQLDLRVSSFDACEVNGLQFDLRKGRLLVLRYDGEAQLRIVRQIDDNLGSARDMESGTSIARKLLKQELR